MSALRVYAETASCLLNTGPEIDHDTDAIRRSMKEEVLLSYDPGSSFLRCYVQVQRAQPEQFAFEYEYDGDGDVFQAFVREARSEVEKTNWRIIDENSAVFSALAAGVRADLGVAQSDVEALLAAGEPVEFAATDRETAVGLLATLRETFGDEHSVAISRAGRVEPVTDADFVIVPDQPYTGLTGATEDRLERVRVDYWRDELGDAVDAVAGGTDAPTRLAAHVERSGLADRFDVAARPADASRTGPARRWFAAVAVVGGLAAVALLLATLAAGDLAALLSEPRRLDLLAGVPGVGGAVTYPSWVAVAGAGLALAGGVAAAGSVPSPGSLRGASREADGAPALEGETDRGIDECLDRIVEAADRETAVEALTEALGDRGVEVASTRSARLRSVGARAGGAAAGAAVAAGVYLAGGSLLPAVVSLLADRWSLAVDALLAVSVLVLAGGLVVRRRTTGPSAGTTPAAAPDRRSSAVSRARIRRLLDRADDPDHLTGRVDPQRLLDELESNPGRDDVAALLRAYEEAASVTVVPPNQRHLLDRSSGDGDASHVDDATGRGRGTASDHGGPGPRHRGAGSDVDRELSGGASRDRDAGDRPAADRPTSGSGGEPGTGPDRDDRSAAPARDDAATTRDDAATTRDDDATTDPETTTEPGTEADRDPETTTEPGTEADRDPETTTEPGTEASTERDDDAFTFGALDGPTPEGERGTADAGESTPDDGDAGAPAGAGDERSGAAAADAGRGAASGDDGPEPPAGFPAFRYDAANSGHVRARSPGSGARPAARWEYRTDDEPLPPVVADGTVYVVDGGGGVYAVDDDGAGRWTTAVDGSVTSAPAVADGVLYFGSDDGTLYAVDGGEVLWSERVGESTGPLNRGTAAIITPPAVVDGTVYVGDVEGYLHARDARTGRERWRAETAGALYGKPGVRGETVFVANDRGELAAYDVDGDRRWSAGAGEGITTTPAMGEAWWYVVDGNGVVHRLDPSQAGAAVGTHPTSSSNPVSPTVGDRGVYVGTRTGTVIALDADLQERRWTTDVDRDERILAPFVLDERFLYVAAGTHVHALDPSTGERHWRFRLTDAVTVQPAYADGTLFVPTASGRIRALDLE